MLVPFRFLALAALVAAAPLAAAADPLDYAGLKKMMTDMGYTPNELPSDSSPIFEVTVVTEGFNVPIAFEVSRSGRYVWARANLGKPEISGDKALALLKKNAELQPSIFWVTSNGTLLLGMPIDNRDITATHLRFVLDKIAADVGASASVWGN